jgi:hypothetical protein
MLRTAGMLGPLLAASLLGASCQSEGSSTESAAPATDPLVQELCPAACLTVQSCAPSTLELPACEAQCAMELGGTGYLIPEIARKYFQVLHDQQADPECYYTAMFMWEMNPADPGAYDAPVDDLVTFNECVSMGQACIGGPLGYTEHGCFFSYYRYNVAYREAIRQCWDLCPSLPSDCVCAKQPSAGKPWVTLPAPPSSGGGTTCPPSE